jgi:hypothetical protein
MFYRAASNQYIVEQAPFTIDGTGYPADWLNKASAEDKATLGLVEVTYEGTREDDRFYWVTENRNGAVISYTNTAKDLAALKAQWKAQINQNAYTMLLPSDWMVVKAVETSTAVAADWTTYRAAVRTAAATAVAAIEAAADVPALQAAVQVTWPNDPNFVAPTETDTQQQA